jgi:hypothetical protein
MADKVDFNIDLADLAGFTPSEGLGSNALLKMDGIYTGTIAKVIKQKSKSGNPMFLVQFIVQDVDEKGQSILHNVLVGGKDKNGEGNIKQLGQLMISCGYSVEQVQALAKNGTVPSDAIINALTGKTATFECEAEAYEGRLSSKISNFVTKSKLDEAVAVNAHRKPRRADMAFAGAPAGAAPVIGGPAAGGGLAAIATNGAAPAAVADPLKALAGLQLKI